MMVVGLVTGRRPTRRQRIAGSRGTVPVRDANSRREEQSRGRFAPSAPAAWIDARRGPVCSADDGRCAARRRVRAGVAAGRGSRCANGGITVRATRIDAPPRLDGVLDEELYRTIQPVTDFIQQEPVEGRARY